MDQEKIGKFILNLRKSNNLTQKELADKLNVTSQAVSKWENGRGIPDISFLKLLSKEFNINIDELLNGEVEKKNNYKLKIILSLGLLLIISILIGFMIIKDDNFSVNTITSTDDNFIVKGVVAYNNNQKGIYITSIEYLDSDDTNYVINSCGLYEHFDNVDSLLKECDNVKMFESYDELSADNMNNLLRNIEFHISDYESLCKDFLTSDLYIEVKLIDSSEKFVYYTIPIKISEEC